MLKSFEGGGLGRSCCPWLPETAGEGASAQLGGVPDLLRRGDLRLHGQPGRRGEVGPLGGVPQPGGDAQATELGLQRGRRCRREGPRRQESLPGDFQPCLFFDIPHQTKHQVLANLCRMKFLDFILDKDWSCSVAEQWDCAFEWRLLSNSNIFSRIIKILFAYDFHHRRSIIGNLCSSWILNRTMQLYGCSSFAWVFNWSTVGLPIDQTAPESECDDSRGELLFLRTWDMYDICTGCFFRCASISWFQVVRKSVTEWFTFFQY